MLRTDRTELSARERADVHDVDASGECLPDDEDPVAERPIFHHLEHRVETHIFLCVLAYHLLVAIETTLLNQSATSWATIPKTLSTHQVATIVLPTDRGNVLRIRKGMTPEPAHLELYRLLNVPQEIMHPIKTCSLHRSQVT